MQLTPKYFGGQIHRKDPLVLWHTKLPLQLCFPVTHSFTSAKQRCMLLFNLRVILNSHFRPQKEYWETMKQFSYQKYYSLCRFNYVCLSFSYVRLLFNCLLVIQLCPFVFQLCLLVVQLLYLIMPAWHSIIYVRYYLPITASSRLSCTRFENGVKGNSRCERFRGKRRKLSTSINIVEWSGGYPESQ